MNWGWFFLRIAFFSAILIVLFLSQRFWYRSLWRMTGNWGTVWLRILTRVAYVALLVLIIVSAADGFRMGHRGHLIPNDNLITVFAGLWFSSAVFAYFAVKLVRVVERVWTLLRRSVPASSTPSPERAGLSAPAKPDRSKRRQPFPEVSPATVEMVPDPSRRYFFRTASAVAGAAPFLSAVYGFAAERLNYQVRHVEIPLANIPSGLEGLKIVQISDIHLSGYISGRYVARIISRATKSRFPVTRSRSFPLCTSTAAWAPWVHRYGSASRPKSRCLPCATRSPHAVNVTRRR